MKMKNQDVLHIFYSISKCFKNYFRKKNVIHMQTCTHTYIDKQTCRCIDIDIDR